MLVTTPSNIAVDNVLEKFIAVTMADQDGSSEICSINGYTAFWLVTLSLYIFSFLRPQTIEKEGFCYYLED